MQCIVAFRELCLTITAALVSRRFLSVKLGRQFDHVAETLLPPLFLLLPNSAKVMATSGSVCLTIILKVRASRGEPCSSGLRFNGDTKFGALTLKEI